MNQGWLAVHLRCVLARGRMWLFFVLLYVWAPSVLLVICPILSGSVRRAGRRAGRGGHGRLAAGHRLGAL